MWTETKTGTSQKITLSGPRVHYTLTCRPKLPRLRTRGSPPNDLIIERGEKAPTDSTGLTTSQQTTGNDNHCYWPNPTQHATTSLRSLHEQRLQAEPWKFKIQRNSFNAQLIWRLLFRHLSESSFFKLVLWSVLLQLPLFLVKFRYMTGKRITNDSTVSQNQNSSTELK